MQFVENLSDRQAADSVRSRIDWKYVLGLVLTDPGFDFSVLSEFRARLIDGNYEQRLLDTMLAQLEERGVLKARGQQRTDATHVLAAIRPLNRLEMVGETMRAALNELAVAAPAWLLEHSRPEWLERYGVRVDVYRLPKPRPDVRRWRRRSGKMDTRFWRRSMIPPHRAGCAACRPCRRCGRCGSSSSGSRTSGCVGASRLTSHRPGAVCIRPMIRKRCAEPSGGKAGSATRCT